MKGLFLLFILTYFILGFIYPIDHVALVALWGACAVWVGIWAFSLLTALCVGIWSIVNAE